MSDYPFAAVEQGDVAFLEDGGVAYRCYVWQRNTETSFSENRRFVGAAVEAAIYTEGPDGQSVLLYRAIVRSPPAGEFVDCPRVVAYGTEFHVYWIEYDPDLNDGGDPRLPAGRDLHRSTIDVTVSPYAWTHQGSQPMHWYMLYDVHTFDASEDYVLAYATAADTIAMVRVNGSTWLDQAWTASVGSLSLGERVLCVIADRASPMAIYQTGNRIFAFSRTWASGAASQAETQIMGGIDDVVVIGGTRRGDGDDGEVWMIAEAQKPDDASGVTTMPYVVHWEMDTTALAAVGRTETYNVTLESKPWKYDSQRSAALFTGTRMYFACLGFISRTSYPGLTPADEDWNRTAHYVARFEGSGSDYDGRPIPVATLNYGIAHSAMHGQVPPTFNTDEAIAPTGPSNTKRRNHIPNATPAPSFGPRQKSYTTLLPKWTRRDNSTAVAGAELRSTTFHHDDPWAYPYDDTDAALPSEPYAATSVPQLEWCPAGDGLFAGGGTPQTYDGHRFVECGFPWRPEVILGNNTGVGTLDAGDYTYVLVYEWRDNRGQTHRAISDPYVVTSGGSFSNQLVIRTCNLSMKDNEALGYATSPPVIIDVYRTEVGGSTFYPLYRGNTGFANDLIDVPLNDPTVDSIIITDAQSDATINDRLPLPYTYASGVWVPLLPEKPPAMTCVTRWQNRVWGVAAEDPQSLWYSQEILPEFAGEKYSIPEFSPTLRYRIDGVGRVVAMIEMDSALVLFTRDAIYSLHGLPADSTGGGASLQIQTLQRGTGCIEPGSVASAPDGVYFQSRRGFYHISRQNALTYVGADVEDELRAAGNIRAVTVHEDSHQVRVLCNGAAYDSPQVLVYDWLFKLWASWPLPAANPNNGRSSAVDAVSWRGHVGEHAHVVALTSGVLVQKPSTDAARFADESASSATVAIPVDVRTGWISLSGLAGFKRIRKLGLHLTKDAAASYTVEIEYDTDGQRTTGANLQTETIASTDVDYIEIRTAVQKCSSIRIRIYEGSAIPSGAQLTAQTMNLHAITLVVARKPGLTRVSPTSQRT